MITAQKREIAFRKIERNGKTIKVTKTCGKQRTPLSAGFFKDMYCERSMQVR